MCRETTPAPSSVNKEKKRGTKCGKQTGYLQSLPVAVEEGLDQTFVLGYRLEDFTLGRDVTDGPLAQSRAGQSEHVTSSFVDVALQS
jgi:hypothetical protein